MLISLESSRGYKKEEVVLYRVYMVWLLYRVMINLNWSVGLLTQFEGDYESWNVIDNTCLGLYVKLSQEDNISYVNILYCVVGWLCAYF